MLNRNKRSIALDLKQQAGVEVAKRLAARADIVIENFRPGVMDRLGLGWETLSKINPRLVYCASSGFGHQGPYVKRPGPGSAHSGGRRLGISCAVRPTIPLLGSHRRS